MYSLSRHVERRIDVSDQRALDDDLEDIEEYCDEGRSARVQRVLAPWDK